MRGSEEALDANRAGRLSDDQRRELDAAARQHHAGVMGPDLSVDVSQEGIAQVLSDTKAARDTQDKVAAAEARAEWAALEHGMEAYVPTDAAPISPSDPATLASAIVGTWSSPFLTVSARDDGTLTTEIPGVGEESGRWSVDADGRLHLEAMGGPHVVDASVDGEWLSLAIQGQSFRLKRSAGI